VGDSEIFNVPKDTPAQMTQLMIAYSVLVKSKLFLWQAPVLLIASGVTGTLVGLASVPLHRTMESLPLHTTDKDFDNMQRSLGKDLIFLVFISLVVTTFLGRTWFHVGILYCALLIFLFLSRAAIVSAIRALLRFWGLFAWIMIAQCLYTPGRYLFWKITYEGMDQALFLENGNQKSREKETSNKT